MLNKQSRNELQLKKKQYKKINTINTSFNADLYMSLIKSINKTKNICISFARFKINVMLGDDRTLIWDNATF